MEADAFGAIPERSFVGVAFLVTHEDTGRASVPSVFTKLDEA